MEIWKAIVIGIVQGLAEFLPISSSGHIVITEFLLGVRPFPEGMKGDVAFEVVLHVGTLLSVIVYFWPRLWRMVFSLWTPELKEERRWIWFLFLATLPAVILVLTPLKDSLFGVYKNPVLVCGLLIVTGALLLIPRFIKVKEGELGWKAAVAMGLGQALAILPGISRSGSSITAGLLSGVNPSKAAEFSFLMSIPAIVGGVVFELDAMKDIVQGELLVPYLLGALAAFLSGLFAVSVVLKAIRRGKFQYFAYYCFAAGLVGMIYFSSKGF